MLVNERAFSTKANRPKNRIIIVKSMYKLKEVNNVRVIVPVFYSFEIFVFVCFSLKKLHKKADRTLDLTNSPTETRKKHRTQHRPHMPMSNYISFLIDRRSPPLPQREISKGAWGGGGGGGGGNDIAEGDCSKGTENRRGLEEGGKGAGLIQEGMSKELIGAVEGCLREQEEGSSARFQNWGEKK